MTTPHQERRRDLACIALLIAAVTLLLSDLVILGTTLSTRDLFLAAYPERQTLRDIVGGGEFPYWTPRFAAGQPFAANPGPQVFYPLRWLTLFVPDPLGYHLDFILHLAIAAVGMFCLLRSFGARHPASVLAGFTYAVGGLLPSLSNLVLLLFSATWLPWVILFGRRFFRDRRASDFAIAALLLGTLMLAGEQSTILIAGALLFAYAFEGTKPTLRSTGAIAAWTAAISLTALLVSAVLIFPAFDLQRDVLRTSFDYAQTTEWSLLPLRPLEMLFPTLFGSHKADGMFLWSAELFRPFNVPFIFSFYPGLLIGAAVIAGFVHRTRMWKLTAIIAGFSYLLALGKWGPLWPLMYALGVRGLRYPEKFFIAGWFALLIFAALTLDRLDRVRRAMLIVISIAGAIASALFVWSLTPSYATSFASVWNVRQHLDALVAHSREGWMVSALVAIALLIALLVQPKLRAATGLALLATIVFADAGLRMNGIMRRTPPGYFDPPPIAQRLLREHAPNDVRIFNDAAWKWTWEGMTSIDPTVAPFVFRNALAPRSPASHGFQNALEIDVNGTQLSTTNDFSMLFWMLRMKGREDRLPLLVSMAGVTHVLAPKPFDSRVADPFTVDPVRVIAFPPNRRYYFADAIVPAHSQQEMLAHLESSAAFSPHVAFTTIAPFDVAPGSVDRVNERANRLALDVTASGRSLLVLAITPHRYWRATIDGRDVDSHRVNLGFQGVVVPAGRHRVELRYRNPVIVACGVVSLGAVAVLLTIAIGGRLRSTTPPPPSPR